MGSSHYIISELAQIEGELMGYHEGLDMMGKEANLSNLSSGLLEQSKKLNKIAKDIIGMESDWKKKVEGLRRIGYDVEELSCVKCGSDPEDCSCAGFNEAIDEVLDLLKEV